MQRTAQPHRVEYPDGTITVTWWAESRSGQWRIACRPSRVGPGWEVYALRKGTHDIAHAAHADTESDARRAANRLWRTL